MEFYLLVSEGSVRAELMEQVPHIAMLCHEDKERLHSLILDHLLPLIVKYLADIDNQVLCAVSLIVR